MSTPADDAGDADRVTIDVALKAWEDKGPTSLTVALLADALYGARAEVDSLRAERDALAQAIHDGRGILGFDNDGDKEPHTSDYVQYAEFWVADAREQRKDYDDALDEDDSLRVTLAAVEAKIDALHLGPQFQDEFAADPVSLADVRADAFDEAVAYVCQMGGLRNIGWHNPYRSEAVTPNG